MPPPNEKSKQEGQRKRRYWTIEEKLQHIENARRPGVVLSQYLKANDIPESTFRGWVENESKMRIWIQQGHAENRSHMREGNFAIVSISLYEWFCDQRKAYPTLPISMDTLRYRAEAFLAHFIALGTIIPKGIPGAPSDQSAAGDSSHIPDQPKETHTSVPQSVFPSIVTAYRGIYNPNTCCWAIVVLENLFMHIQFRQTLLSLDLRKQFSTSQPFAEMISKLTGESVAKLLATLHLPSTPDYPIRTTFSAREFSIYSRANMEEVESRFRSFDAIRGLFAQLSTAVPIIDTVEGDSQQTGVDTPKTTLGADLERIFFTKECTPLVQPHSLTSFTTMTTFPESFIDGVSKTVYIVPPVQPDLLLLYENSNGEHISFETQEDASDFLEHLLDRLSDILIIHQYPNFVRKFFYSSMVLQHVCERGHQKSREQTLVSIINIQLDNETNLEAALHSQHIGLPAEEDICPICVKQVRFQTKTAFSSLANTIIFRLNRYKLNDAGSTVLDTKKFAFPLDELDMSPYMQTPSDDSVYHLVGVICHRGCQLEAGHYITFIRERTEPHRWILFNDSGVSTVTIQSMKKILYGTSIKTQKKKSRDFISAYILFYERCRPQDDWWLERQATMKFSPSSQFNYFTLTDVPAIELEEPVPNFVKDSSSDEANADESSGVGIESSGATESTNEENEQEEEEHENHPTDKHKKVEKVTDPMLIPSRPLLPQRVPYKKSKIFHTEPLSPGSDVDSFDSAGSSTTVSSTPFIRRKGSRHWTARESDNKLGLQASKLFAKSHVDDTIFKQAAQMIDRSYLERWKKRWDIVFRTHSGEAGASKITAGDKWISNVLPPLVAEFHHKHLFNGDETGLYWRRLPRRGLGKRGDKMEGGKESKSRVTVFLAASATGEKLPMMVIGASDHPRSFPRDYKPPFMYRSSPKAWMTRKLFKQYVRKLNRAMKTAGRTIVLVVDNCSAHKIRERSHVKLRFLPPNVTSTHQPFDAGIIAAFKSHYRRKFLREVFIHCHPSANERPSTKWYTLYNCVQHLEDCWDQVSEETITHCFEHAWPTLAKKKPSIHTKERSLPQPTTTTLPSSVDTTPNEADISQYINQLLPEMVFLHEDCKTVRPYTTAEISLLTQHRWKKEHSESLPVSSPNPVQTSQDAPSADAPSRTEVFETVEKVERMLTYLGDDNDDQIQMHSVLEKIKLKAEERLSTEKPRKTIQLQLGHFVKRNAT